MSVGYTTVSSALLSDASGVLVANATISFQPCNASSVPLSFRVNGAGQAMYLPVTATVTNGVFSVALADTTLSSPVNIAYAVTVIDNVTGKSLLGPGYLIQPSGTSFNFDTFVPNLPALTTIQLGMTGPAGPTGATGPAGPTGPSGPVGGAFATATPLVAATVGAVGTSTGSAHGDHVHPSEVTGLAIAPSSVTASQATIPVLNGSVAVGGYVTDAGWVLIPNPNRLGLIWGVWDASGNVALGVTLAGAVVGPALLPAGSSVSGSDVNLPGNLFANGGYLFDQGSVALSPYNPLGLIWAIFDSTYQVSCGITKAGLFVTYGSTATSAVTSSGTASLNQTANPYAPNVDALSFYNTADGSAIQQISAIAETTTSTFNSTSPNNYATVSSVEAAKQLTTGSTSHSTQPAPNQDNSWVRFLKTPVAGGAPTLMKMNRWGQHQITAASAYAKLYALSHVLFGGQSLSIGTTGTPVLSTTEPFSNLMFNGGTVPSANDLTTAMPVQTSLLPLIEAVLNGASGETIATCFAATVYQWMAEAGILMPLLMSGWGVGGQQYSNLAKGTLAYTRGQQQVSQGQSLATAAGYSTFGVRSLLWIHGEADQFNTAYDVNLATLQANFEADVMALTGQSTNVPLIMCQTSGLCNNAVTPGTVLSQYLQLQASVNNPGKIVLTGPSYMCQYNNIHMTNQGYRKLAGYFAKAWLKTVFQNQPWRPLSPRKIVRDGVNIYVDFWVPVPPIRINLGDVLQPTFVTGSKYGFEYWDASGSPPAITAVNVIGPTTLQIVLASVPTGSTKQLRYAYSFSPSTIAGPTTGQRGNLCDSDTSTNYAGDTLTNWCVHFNQAIN
jgi:hypothetical protein